jgi:hypothetical protein
MNYLRTLILISVFFIQISGLMMNNISESFRSSETSSIVTHELKFENSHISETPSKVLQLQKKEEPTCENNPLCRKEAPIKGLDQPGIITKTTENIPVKTAPTENKKPLRKVSVISRLRNIGTGSTELF